jgi:hypothetical protein
MKRSRKTPSSKRLRNSYDAGRYGGSRDDDAAIMVLTWGETGNSHFTDTDRRSQDLEKRAYFLDVGLIYGSFALPVESPGKVKEA